MTAAEQIREIRASTGLSQAKFSAVFGIQCRTLEKWESGDRKPPDYVINLLRIAVDCNYDGIRNEPILPEK